MLEEFFGLAIPDPELRTVKSLMAQYYRATCRKLMNAILAGRVMHVDEAQVNLRSGKGYVWVFTNLEEVVFMYRPTREGEFMKKLLRNFKGVLVSDFYAAYDPVQCPQQKCIIHLMRDMNQLLLDNPYDEELQSVTQPFGKMLRAIVKTIDLRGLKERHLRKHQQQVDEFLAFLSGRPFASEAAESLRDRLVKYQDKLFTFLRHDGVPWNNNAENAIKRFAYHRSEIAYAMKEEGLNDYLVMLSLYQTCRYKGISFLKFLNSRERDVDVFCQNRRRKRRRQSVELYPKGFVPQYLRGLRKGRPESGSGGPDQDALSGGIHGDHGET